MIVVILVIWTIIVLCGVAGALAAKVGIRAPEHRPIAVALLCTFAGELVRAGLVEYVLPSPPPLEPLEGALRLAIAADRALYIVWPAAVAAVGLRVLARRPAWPALAGWAIAAAVLAIWYRELRFDTLRRAYLALDLIASFVAVASLIVHAQRRRRGEEKGPRAAPTAAAIMVGGHFASIPFGAYSQNLWGGAWILALACNTVTFAALAVAYGVIAWRTRNS